MYCPAGASAGTLCPDGTYNTEDALESVNQCWPCPVSKYCQNGVVVGPCDAGYFCSSGADLPNNLTYQCPIGHYCLSGSTAPIRCEPGKINPSLGGDDPSDCTDCPIGFYCP